MLNFKNNYPMHFNNLIFKTEEQRIGPSLCLFLRIILPVRQIMLARCVPLGQVSEYKFTHKKSSGSVRCISLKKLTVPAAVQSLNMYNQIKTFQIILIMYILYMYNCIYTVYLGKKQERFQRSIQSFAQQFSLL